MHGGNGQIMMRMLDARQPLRQFALVMIVDVGEVGDARALEVAFFGVFLQMVAQDIPDRLAAGRVTAFLDEFIERGREAGIERNRETFHEMALDFP